MLDRETILQSAVTWASGQTEFQNENFVMNSHVTKYRQIRQAFLEIEGRYHAARKIKVDMKRDEVKIKKLQKELEICQEDFEKELIEIEIEDLRIDNDVRARKLARSESELDVFIKRIQENVNSEEDIQRYFDQDPEEEEKYWVARMGKQAAIDILAYGRISSGNLDSISMLPEEKQLQILSIGFQYSNLLGKQLSKIDEKTREFAQNLLKNPDNLSLPTFEGIEDNMQVKMLDSIKKDILDIKKIKGNSTES